MAVRLLGAVFSRLSLKTISTKSTPCSSIKSLLPTTSFLVSRNTLGSAFLTTQSKYYTSYPSGSITATSRILAPQSLGVTSQIQNLSTTALCQGCSLQRMHRTGPIKKKRKNKNPLGYNKPFAKGVVLKTLIKKPKKPNSANRKCVLVRLSTGKEMIAFVPGEGHNLQEHNIVLVRPGRLRDVPGVKIRCVRGVYDLQHVVKKQH